MSLVSNDSAIKRFTYDWLIRFAELHPFLLRDPPYDYRKLKRSKYSAISPLFAALISRHIPDYIYYGHWTCVEYCLIKKYEQPTSNKCTIIYGATIVFADVPPGMITCYKNSHVFFYGELLLIFDSTTPFRSKLTPDELRYLLKFCKFGNFYESVKIDATLTDPIMFSEVWPHLARCRHIVSLNVENLIYGENMANILRENGGCPNSLHLRELDLSEKAMLEVFDYILALPDRPTDVQFRFQQHQPRSLGEAIIDKYASSGVPLFELCEPPQVSFRNMTFWEADGELWCYFIDQDER